MTAVALATDIMGAHLPPITANLIGDQIATVAGIGTAQSGAAAIGTSIVIGTTAASQTAFVLPAAWPLGKGILFTCTTATAALIFPATGGTIDSGSANASVSVAQNKSRILVQTSTGVWYSVGGA